MSDKNKDLFVFANRTVTKNVTDTSNNNKTLTSVNRKGELLVGNGTGPIQLDPNTGSNGDCLIKDSTTTLGVRWGQPSVLPYIAATVMSWDPIFTLTPELNGATVLYNNTGGVVNLPSNPPNGVKYVMNSLVNASLHSPGSSIRDRCNVFAAGVQLNTSTRFDIVYNSTTTQWDVWIITGSSLLASVP